MDITIRRLAVWSGMYLLASGVLSRLIVSSYSIVFWGILSLPSIILVPLLVGLALVESLGKSGFQGLGQKTGKGLAIWIAWCLGILVFVSLTVVLQLLNSFTVYLIPFLAGGSALYLTTKTDHKFVMISTRTLLILLCIVGISFVPVLLASVNMPFPLFGLNFDTPAFIMQPVERAIQYNYFSLNVQIIDQFLTLIGCFWFNIGPGNFLWFARFLLEAIFCIGVYFLVNKTTKRPLLAFLSATFAPFLMVGTMGFGGFNLYFDTMQQDFRSNTLIYAVFPFLLSSFGVMFTARRTTYGTTKIVLPPLLFGLALFIFSAFPWTNYGLPNGYNLLEINPLVISILAVILVIAILYMFSHGLMNSSLFLMVTTLVLWLMHSVEFIAFEAILLFYLIVTSWSDSSLHVIKRHISQENVPKMLVISSVILVVLGFVMNKIAVTDFKQLSFNVPFLFIYQGANVLFYEIPKIPTFIYGNGPVILALLVVGSLIVIYRHTKVEAVFFFMFAFTLFLYFVPLGWTYRLFKEMVPFMTILVALPFYLLAKSILSSNHKRTLRYLSLGVLLFVVMGGMAIPSWQRATYHDSTMPESNWQSFMSYNELTVSSFLATSTPRNSVIVSDPFTVYMLSSLSDRVQFYDKSQFEVNGMPSALYVADNVFLLNQRENLSVLDFDGISGYVRTSLPSPNGPFSIDLWAERTGPVNYSLSIATISGWRYITDVLDGIILSPGNELDFRNWDGNQTVFLQSGVTMQQSVWYNIAVTFDGSNLSMYVNGALAASTPFEQSAVNSDEFDLGAIVSNYGQNRAFNGSLSTVQIYNRALSLDEVATLYSAPLQSFNGQTLWFNAADTNANSTVIPNLVSNSTYGILENGADSQCNQRSVATLQSKLSR